MGHKTVLKERIGKGLAHHDLVVAAAFLGPMLPHCHVVTIHGENCRLCRKTPFTSAMPRNRYARLAPNSRR